MSCDKLTGYECEFKTQVPPRWKCPVCLLIIREPYQVLCCGKSFCEACIHTLKSLPCPTCKSENFVSFPDKGLKQELHSSVVFCSNRQEGCEWSGELGDLDDHLNADPSKGSAFSGCTFTDVMCSHCKMPYKRSKVEEHQISECSLRPFTCQFCEDFDSTYQDVKESHESICKFRPVECPNLCGTNNLQQQNLDEHLSSQCPLSYVSCMLKDIGCDAELHRKDLNSHMIDNMVTHMMLLACENKRNEMHWEKRQTEISELKLENTKLKESIEKQEGDIEVLRSENSQLHYQIESVMSKLDEFVSRNDGKFEDVMKTLEFEMNLVKSYFRVPPIDFIFPSMSTTIDGNVHTFEPFYARFGGCNLQLTLQVFFGSSTVTFQASYVFVKGDFEVPLPCNLYITTLLVDQVRNRYHRTLDHLVTSNCQGALKFVVGVEELKAKYIKNDSLLFRVTKIDFR